jgi:hypothetical protein
MKCQGPRARRRKEEAPRRRKLGEEPQEPPPLLVFALPLVSALVVGNYRQTYRSSTAGLEP